MALTGEMYGQLNAAMVSAFGADMDELRKFVRFKLDGRAVILANQNKPIDDVALSIIGYVDSKGMSMVLKLVNALYESYSGNDLVAAFYVNLLARRVNIPDDPLSICWFPTQKPFVNRVRLRQAVRDLKDVPLRRGLLISGEPGSGKTYSKELIDFVQDETRGYEPIYIDLTRQEKFQADEIVRRILTHMGKDEPLPSFDTSDSPKRWAAALAAIVYRKALETQKVWWLILDEFKKIAVQPGVIELVEELAELIGTGSAPLRLILVNYPGVLPPSVKSRFDREDVAAVTRKDVRDFFKQFFAGNGGADDATIDEVTDASWNTSAAAPSSASLESLEAISVRIEQKVLDLLNARKAGTA